MFGGAEIPDFKTLDSHVTFVLNCKYALSAGGSEMRCVQNRRFAREAPKGNESIARIAGFFDGHQFFVDSSANVDRTTRLRDVCGVLNRAPRRRLSARIRIIPGRRYVERRVRLAKRCGNAS